MTRRTYEKHMRDLARRSALNVGHKYHQKRVNRPNFGSIINLPGSKYDGQILVSYDQAWGIMTELMYFLYE